MKEFVTDPKALDTIVELGAVQGGDEVILADIPEINCDFRGAVVRIFDDGAFELVSVVNSVSAQGGGAAVVGADPGD